MALTKVIGNGLGAVTQDGAATFNESSADVDFRIESNSNANMFFVDAGNDKIGINTNAPNRMLGIENGDVQIHETGSSDPLLQFSVGNTQASPTQSYSLRIDNSDSDKFQLINGTSGAVALSVDTTGAITKPLQPAFLVQPTSAQSDVPHGANQTVVFNNERFDQNSDFNSSNYTFTAPVTGKYFLSYSLWVSNIDNQPSYWETYIITSNRNYLYTIDPRAFDQDAGSFTFNNSLIADMDSGDTAKIQILQQNSGTEQSDIQNYSFFSGALIC